MTPPGGAGNAGPGPSGTTAPPAPHSACQVQVAGLPETGKLRLAVCRGAIRWWGVAGEPHLQALHTGNAGTRCKRPEGRSPCSELSRNGEWQAPQDTQNFINLPAPAGPRGWGRDTRNFNPPRAACRRPNPLHPESYPGASDFPLENKVTPSGPAPPAAPLGP